jgi:nitroreductase
MISTALGLSESAIQQVLSAAGMAPSLFNIQPWRFRLCPDRIEVHADLGRRLIAHDPEDRELRIACGAALFNLRLALHANGVTPVVTIEAGDQPDALAVIRRGPASVQSHDDTALHKAIKQRRTNRHAFLDAPMPTAYPRVLTDAAAAEGAALRTITTQAERLALRCIIAAADQRQRADVVCRAEMEAWTGFRNGHPDGVPLAAAGPKPEPQDPLAFRDIGNGFARVRPRGEDFEVEPFLVVLSTPTDGPGCQVQAGQALQRLLLTATALGLSASFLSQPIEVSEERRELRRLLADGRHPQAVVRLGVGAPVGATPRRDPADLLLPEPVGSAH